MSSQCYVAAALFTPSQLRVNSRIAAIVREVGMEPFLPSVMSAEIWKGRAPKDCEPWERRAVVEGNIEGMLKSAAMIARVSGDTKEVDTGVAWEMGYYWAIDRMESAITGMPPERKRILIAYIEPSDRAQSLNLMLAETVSAAVYGDAQLHALLDTLQGSSSPQMVTRALGKFATDKIIRHEREPIGLDSEREFGDVRTETPGRKSITDFEGDRG